MSPTVLWLLAGAACVGIEMFGAPGMGFLFAGIAALIVGGAIEIGIIAPDNTVFQFALFFLTTSVSAALLWKKLKQVRKPNYSNIIGDEAMVVGSGLSGNIEGQVKWSGTLMRARIDEEADIDVLPSGVFVVVTKVDGNVLYVKPKH